MGESVHLFLSLLPAAPRLCNGRRETYRVRISLGVFHRVTLSLGVFHGIAF